MKALEGRGFKSPYLRTYAVARINPVRFAKEVKITVDQLLDKMLSAAERFQVGKVSADEVKATAGYGGDEE